MSVAFTIKTKLNFNLSTPQRKALILHLKTGEYIHIYAFYKKIKYL